MARPSKRTQSAEDRIVAAIKLGATLQRAAAAGGITYRALRYWLDDAEQRGEDSPSFQLFQSIKAAESYRAEQALKAIQRAATQGNWQAAAWYLERRYPHEYGKTVQEHSGEHQVQITISRRSARSEQAEGQHGH